MAKVVYTDWRDRAEEPEIVGVYEDERDGYKAREKKECQLQSEGYDTDEEVRVWIEDIEITKSSKRNNLWNATDEEMKAGDVLKAKIFEYIKENKEYLNEKRTRQILKSMFTTWVILVDTDIDKSDSDRLMYDMIEEVYKYTGCDRDRLENLLVGLLV